MKTVDVTPKQWLWLFDIALRQNDDKLIKEALEYGKRLEERRLEECKKQEEDERWKAFAAFHEIRCLEDNERESTYRRLEEERRIEEQKIKDQALVYDQINSKLEGE